ncbi:hypothetical protein [Magnetospirillum fulvum]|uniref:Nucleotidyltransferase family protein n=1 Tax=Magnetospirillum fulvum TaxID=1082 RepID=A0A1H6GV65_MAGFU|nr:hypothetical protein [Magnetospirillum fulvum]SEH25725.1 hypothetical protein SAMN04244559_00283 [Magnetospirillum fulvum]
MPNCISSETLRSRLRYFLWQRPATRDQISMVLEALRDVGPSAIFGGLLRDLCLLGSRNFQSDVDIVVDSQSQDDIERRIFKWKPVRNKFGGYRFSVGGQKFDVWMLNNTWAFQRGYVVEADFSTLPLTTFFNWDAVAYRIDDRSIICSDDYFSELSKKVIDVNLRENPNPIGYVVRTLRMAAIHQPLFSPRLIHHMNAMFEIFHPLQIIKAEHKAYARPMLSVPYLDEISQKIVKLTSDEIHFPARLTPHQLGLPL